MRRAGMVLVVALLVLLGVAALVDRIAVGSTARGIASDLTAGSIRLDPDAEVRIHGFPYLTQLMVGRLSEVTVTASGAVVDELTLTDVQGAAHGVETSAPYTALDAEITATVPTDTIRSALMRSTLAERGLDIDVEVRDPDVVVSTTFLGLPVEAVLKPTPAGRTIALDVRTVSIAGLTVSAAEMPRALRQALDDLALPLETLPEGLDLTNIEVVPEGLRLTASGADLDLGTLAP